MRTVPRERLFAVQRLAGLRDLLGNPLQDVVVAALARVGPFDLGNDFDPCDLNGFVVTGGQMGHDPAAHELMRWRIEDGEKFVDRFFDLPIGRLERVGARASRDSGIEERVDVAAREVANRWRLSLSELLREGLLETPLERAFGTGRLETRAEVVPRDA